MKSNPQQFSFKKATSLDEVYRALARSDRPRLIAGGTDLMVLFESGHLRERNFLGIGHLTELNQITVEERYIEIGAAVTYADIQAHEVILKEFPSLVQAARETGGIAIQNRGTLGGNIVNASPAADSPPALIAYGAEVQLASANDQLWLPYLGFHTGYKSMRLEPDQLLMKVRIPRRKYLMDYYRKVGTRKAQAISKVVCAGTWAEGDQGPVIRFALGSVGPTVIRCSKVERRLLQYDGAMDDSYRELLTEALGEDISPIDDIRSNRNYRLEVSRNLLFEFLSQVDGASK